jgi:hypothetical protein
MNFRRGLFRIWVVLSAGWIMVVGYAGDLPCAFGVTFQPLVRGVRTRPLCLAVRLAYPRPRLRSSYRGAGGRHCPNLGD